MMYKNLEQRMFTAYLIQSPQEFSGRAKKCVESCGLLSVYNVKLRLCLPYDV
jgi:hypothetical protein